MNVEMFVAGGADRRSSTLRNHRHDTVLRQRQYLTKTYCVDFSDEQWIFLFVFLTRRNMTEIYEIII